MRTPKWLFLSIPQGGDNGRRATFLRRPHPVLERPEMFGDKLYLSPEEAEQIAAEMRQLKEAGLKHSDPNREASLKDGDGSQDATGNVGSYNTFWSDDGEAAFMMDRYLESTPVSRYCQAAFAPRGKLCPASILTTARHLLTL